MQQFAILLNWRCAMADSIKYLDSKELAAFFKVIKDPRNRAIFNIIYFRGLRASDPGLIELQDWSPEKQRIRFRRLKGSIGGECRCVVSFGDPLRVKSSRRLRDRLRPRPYVPGLRID
jgi:hypothetical protein